jgi:hydroxymethylbilane synthase
MSAPVALPRLAHAHSLPGVALRAGTRGSRLALVQTRLVLARLAEARPGLLCVEDVISTSGDRVQDRHLALVGGKGLFAKEIDEALLDGRVDFAVHSLKDLETNLPAGIVLACTLPRADPRDALVLPPRHLLEEKAVPYPMLPAGARIGTASARRQAQLLHARPDLRVGLIRGNVQTRLGRLGDGDFAATLLAVAGLDRLELTPPDQSASEPSPLRLRASGPAVVALPPEIMVPAAGQGIIGVTARASDKRTRRLLARINDPAAWAAATAERAVLQALDGSCRTPIGAYARPLPSGDLLLTAMAARADGSFLLKRWRRGPAGQAGSLGNELGASLRADCPEDIFA